MQNHDYDLANRISLAGDPLNNDQVTALLLRELNVGGGMDHDEMTATLRTVLGPYIDNMLTLAAAVKKHVEEGGEAGTHAYEMLAAYAGEDAKTTETLIHMVAATVLSKLIEDEGGGRSNVEFSPADMDQMHRQYEITIEHNGMSVNVKLSPRPEFVESLRQIGADGSEAKPQAEVKAEEPHWFMHDSQGRARASDRRAAENMVRESADPLAQVENRRCHRLDCPAPTHIDNCLASFCPKK